MRKCCIINIFTRVLLLFKLKSLLLMFVCYSNRAIFKTISLHLPILVSYAKNCMRTNTLLFTALHNRSLVSHQRGTRAFIPSQCEYYANYCILVYKT